MKYSLNDLSYSGKYSRYFWDKNYNPNADITNGLANCTTFVFGDCIRESEYLRPVSVIKSASVWDKYLINGWECRDFDKTQLKVGDILQWVNKCHVARVADIINGTVFVSASWYTGEHGKSIYNGKYDTRNSIHSLEELSDFMIRNYPTRFYHYWTLEEEMQGVGGTPEHYFSMPTTISPVPRDTEVNQIEATDNTLRVRLAPNLDGEFYCFIRKGYYNVLSVVKATAEDKAKVEGLECWYEIASGKYCANITTKYLPATSDDTVEELKELVTRLIGKIDTLTAENESLRKGIEQMVDIGSKLIK